MNQEAVHGEMKHVLLIQERIKGAHAMLAGIESMVFTARGHVYGAFKDRARSLAETRGFLDEASSRLLGDVTDVIKSATAYVGLAIEAHAKYSHEEAVREQEVSEE